MLRLPDELYWDLSPREIHGCIVEYWRLQDIENMRAGTICATLRNTNRTKDSQHFFTWEDFFKPITKQSKKESSLDRIRADWARSHEALQQGALRQ